MRVEFSRFVEHDLEAIGDYIARDNPRRALSFVREIRGEIARVGQAPCSSDSGRRSAKARASLSLGAT